MTANAQARRGAWLRCDVDLALVGPEITDCHLIAALQPVDQLKLAVVVLCERSCAFDPIARVDVMDVTDVFRSSVMDVPADDPVDVASRGFIRKRIFKIADEVHGGFHAMLEVGRERPVIKAQSPAHEIQRNIAGKGELISAISQKSEPARIADNDIEFVAVND